MRLQRSVQDGFTLIEVICVVAIIGLLAVIAIPVLSENRPRAHDGVAQSNLRSAYSSAKAYAVSHDGSYKGFTPKELNDDSKVFRGTTDRSVLVPGKTADPQLIVLMDPTRDDIEMCNASKGKRVFCIWDDGSGARYSFGETVASLNPYSPDGWTNPVTVATLPPTNPGTPGNGGSNPVIPETPTGTPIVPVVTENPGGNPTSTTGGGPTTTGGTTATGGTTTTGGGGTTTTGGGGTTTTGGTTTGGTTTTGGGGGTTTTGGGGGTTTTGGGGGNPTTPTNPGTTTKAGDNAGEGITKYGEELTKNPQYWTKCVDAPVGVSSVGGNRVWKTVESGDGQYTILLLPANGATTCDPNNPTTTNIDKNDGTVTVIVTGKDGDTEVPIKATFRRKGFIDYAYFTDYETADPDFYATFAYETRPALKTWAQGCLKFYRNGRSNVKYTGQLNYSGNWVAYTTTCSEIQFTSGDFIAGPMHTNDEFLVCGAPKFGRTKSDKIESVGPNWRGSTGCTSNTPTFAGTWTPNAPNLSPPKTNDALKSIATSGYKFTGKTTLAFDGANVTVNGVKKAIPTNGVIYVDNTSTTLDCSYDFYDPYTAPAGCANVYVSGHASKPVTVASANDIVITENLTNDNNSTLIGLIANGYVRIYHPVNRSTSNATQCTNNGGPGSIEVDASLLALNHSFIVDNYYCGAPTGILTLNGSVAQKFRGPVGTGSGSTVSTGYLKAYTYDDRLRLDTPPSFLDPLETVWGLIRTEVVQNP